ncbi:hypothetical protein VTH06DRAFT_7988 [Thermothelomyces fergusii]
MAPTFARLLRRESEDCIIEDGYIEDGCEIPFWATRTGIIVKWSLFLGLIALTILYFLVAYIHLKQRIRKGLPPLRYHQFLVSRVTFFPADPRYGPPPPPNSYPYYDPAERYYYDMYAMPPPVYDPNAPRPPKYEPPANSTKADPGQSQGAQQGQYQAGESAYGPPPGPPPAPGQPRDYDAPPPGPPPGPPPNAVQSPSSTNQS